MKRALTIVWIIAILIMWFCCLLGLDYYVNHLPLVSKCVFQTAHVSICYITH